VRKLYPRFSKSQIADFTYRPHRELSPSLLRGAEGVGVGVWDVGSNGERRENTLNSFKDFRTEKGSSQGRNLALTGVCVPSLLDSGGVIGTVLNLRPTTSQKSAAVPRRARI